MSLGKWNNNHSEILLHTYDDHIMTLKRWRSPSVAENIEKLRTCEVLQLLGRLSDSSRNSETLHKYITQQLPSQLYRQKNWKLTAPILLQRKGGKKTNTNAHQLINEQTTCDICIQWNIIHKKNKVIDEFYNISMPWQHHGKGKRIDTKGRRLYNPIYMKCPQKEILSDKKLVLALPWAPSSKPINVQPQKWTLMKLWTWGDDAVSMLVHQL